MTIFKVPRVAIHIPGETSRLKFQPEYEYPLFQRVYRGRILDPAGDPLRIVPHPKDCQTYTHFWYEADFSDFADLVSAESERLRAAFGLDEKTGETWFDTLYVGHTFAQAVQAALDSAKTHETDPMRADPADQILDLCTPLGLDRRMARLLTDKGWSNVEALAGADEAQLAQKVGRVNAAKLKRAAEEKLGILINATPAEQITAAKSAKK